jgi:hypothetical protein
MAQGARQSSLFAAEDFSVIYESFSQANFQAYDFDTIRNAMVDYINNNYPENFNDWISSSEFVSLIELMAFLGHNLAFRADLASRENYLSTVERRENALRIAEFLNYTPIRNVVASGYLKIDSVKTTESVFDTNGVSLANVDVQFDDTVDPDANQNFLTIMNAIMQGSSKIGSPFAKFTSAGITNEVYRTNSINNPVTKNFSGLVNGTRTTFEVHSVYYNQNTRKLEEKIPNPYGVIDILYQNDNSGLSSANTGFFVGFKQGSLQYQDFDVQNGLANLVLDINSDNVANGNIWVQTIDEVGQIIKNWTRIDRLYGLNAIFNSVNNNQRDVYTVSSRENDQISIVFGDGNFANIPRGIIRVWYRTGINETYTLYPDNFAGTRFTFDYVSEDGNVYRATFTCSLRSVVSNASERESIASIKANAGRFFSTQDRMVTASDYSIFPFTVSENIRKIKSVNRVHSGHSRFRDFHDPTATYSDATQFTDDGYFYKEDITTRSIVSLPSNLNSEQIFQRYIRPILNNPEVKNFYYNRHYYGINGAYNPNTQYSDTTDSLVFYTLDGSDTNTYRWNQVTKGHNTSTGYITYNSVVQRLGDMGSYPMRKLEPNGLVEFITAPYKSGYIKKITVTNGGVGYTSAPAVTISGTGTGATAVATIDSEGRVVGISVTASGSGYNASTNISFSGGGGSGATAVADIGDDTMWARVVSLKNTGIGEEDATGTPTGIDPTGRGAVVLNKVIPSGARVKRIVPSWEYELIESVKTQVKSAIDNNISFGLRYNPDSQEWAVISNTNLASNNLTSNSPSSWSRLYEGDATDTGRDNSWLVRINYTSSYWEILTRKTRFIFGSVDKIRFNNLNFAETFSSETLQPLRDNIEILNINTSSSVNHLPLGKNYKFNVSGYFTYSDGYTDPYKIRVSLADPDNDGYPDNPAAFNEIVKTDTIGLGNITVDRFTYKVLDTSSPTEIYPGRSDLRVKYSRIADINQVIDPASTNIIDTFVLLRSYENEYRAWANFDGRSYTKPNSPTINDLTALFESLESKKSISDQIVYRPVKFKIIFGDLASEELQCRFIVTKTSNATMSDTEISQNVVNLINNYFNIDNWDFGETFYFSEMASYIHNNMVGQIAQISIEPVNTTTSVNSLLEIRLNSDEMFMPVLKTNNIVVRNNIVYNPTVLASNNGAIIQ